MLTFKYKRRNIYINIYIYKYFRNNNIIDNNNNNTYQHYPFTDINTKILLKQN